MNHTGMDAQDIQYALALSLTRVLQCELLRLERQRHHSACCNTADEAGASHGR